MTDPLRLAKEIENAKRWYINENSGENRLIAAALRGMEADAEEVAALAELHAANAEGGSIVEEDLRFRRARLARLSARAAYRAARGDR